MSKPGEKWGFTQYLATARDVNNDTICSCCWYVFLLVLHNLQLKPGEVELHTVPPVTKCSPMSHGIIMPMRRMRSCKIYFVLVWNKMWPVALSCFRIRCRYTDQASTQNASRSLCATPFSRKQLYVSPSYSITSPNVSSGLPSPLRWLTLSCVFALAW